MLSHDIQIESLSVLLTFQVSRPFREILSEITVLRCVGSGCFTGNVCAKLTWLISISIKKDFRQLEIVLLQDFLPWPAACDHSFPLDQTIGNITTDVTNMVKQF